MISGNVPYHTEAHTITELRDPCDYLSALQELRDLRKVDPVPTKLFTPSFADVAPCPAIDDYRPGDQSLIVREAAGASAHPSTMAYS